MAVALLLNSLAMVFASYRYARKKLIIWRIGIPIIITSSIGAPFGVRLSYYINNDILKICFIILPVLIALGIEPKEAVGTTAPIIIFSSLSGFISHVGLGHLDALFIVVTAAASIAGALIGSWLMTDKLKPSIIKKILGVILIAVAVKMIINLL